MISTSIDNNGIFCVEISGNLEITEINNFVNSLSSMTQLSDNLLALYDFTNASINLKPEEISAIAERVAAVTKGFKSIRAAFVVDGPDITAYTILFNQENTNINTTREVFSTVEAGFQWLLYPIKNT